VKVENVLEEMVVEPKVDKIRDASIKSKESSIKDTKKSLRDAGKPKVAASEESGLSFLDTGSKGSALSAGSKSSLPASSNPQKLSAVTTTRTTSNPTVSQFTVSAPVNVKRTSDAEGGTVTIKPKKGESSLGVADALAEQVNGTVRGRPVAQA